MPAYQTMGHEQSFIRASFVFHRQTVYIVSGDGVRLKHSNNRN
jgi:hypothetical protein